jgi:enamine deaminase RidA (YjgF/YER057c/UK114 family)
MFAVWWLAAAQAQDLTFDAVRKVPVGSDPTITFHAAAEGLVTAQLSCGGKRWSLRRNVAAGKSATLALASLPVGAHRCSGEVRLDQPDGAWAEAPLSLEVEVLDALKWTVSPEDVDLAAKTLVVHPSRPLKAAEVELRGAGGKVLAVETAVLLDPLQPRFSWVTDEEVIVLAVTGVDEAGVRGTLELSPWHYAIPHVDVVFASGQHALDPAELPKLEQCWADVERVLAKYGSVVEIQLFVAGYTDTVGDPASNQALSERRARAIARWFEARGFPGAVWYQGFGEGVLAKPTPDETDERANRRALYLLGAERPPLGGEFPRDAWRRE